MLRPHGILIVRDSRGRTNGIDPPGKTPHRIVFLLEELNFGGTQRQTLELALNLDPERFRPEIWLMAGGDDMARLARKGNVPVIHLSRGSCVGPGSLLKLWRRLKANPPDLLVLMTVIPNIWGRLIGRLARVPLIIGTCRGTASPARQHEKLLWPLPHHHLCNAFVIKEKLSRRYGIPDDLITVIENGVDIEFFKPPGPNCRRDREIILSIGRLVPEKDHRTLFRAFARLAPSHPDAELWIAGNGPMRDEIGQLAVQTRVGDRTRFIPARLDIRQLFRQSSIFVLSSTNEGLPNVVLEAMASGLPIVATRAGGLPEVVEHGRTGLLVPVRDPEALADALDRLLRDEATRTAFGEAGRKRVEDLYSVSSMTARHEELFQRLLKDYQDGSVCSLHSGQA